MREDPMKVASQVLFHLLPLLSQSLFYLWLLNLPWIFLACFLISCGGILTTIGLQILSQLTLYRRFRIHEARHHQKNQKYKYLVQNTLHPHLHLEVCGSNFETEKH
uniref:Uncharacterized protein n=1 Tax=uncultured marine virus TaxID=186617 RepID=A0A0F7LBY0_9VIRU|nr:hypothetical protein [uncultured marine virus]